MIARESFNIAATATTTTATDNKMENYWEQTNGHAQQPPLPVKFERWENNNLFFYRHEMKKNYNFHFALRLRIFDTLVSLTLSCFWPQLSAFTPRIALYFSVGCRILFFSASSSLMITIWNSIVTSDSTEIKWHSKN